MEEEEEMGGRTHLVKDVQFCHNLSLLFLCGVQCDHLHRHYHLGRLVESSGRNRVLKPGQTNSNQQVSNLYTVPPFP